MRRCEYDSGFIRVVVIYITSEKLCGHMQCTYVAMNEITNNVATVTPPMNCSYVSIFERSAGGYYCTLLFI